jgi:hypothetical protein
MEEIRVDGLPAASGAAVTLPNGVAAAVDAVVVRELFVLRNVAKRDLPALSIDGYPVDVRVATVVDPAVRLAEDYLYSAGQVVAMVLVQPLRLFVRHPFRHDVRVIYRENELPGSNRLCRERSFTVNG